MSTITKGLCKQRFVGAVLRRTRKPAARTGGAEGRSGYIRRMSGWPTTTSPLHGFARAAANSAYRRSPGGDRLALPARRRVTRKGVAGTMAKAMRTDDPLSTDAQPAPHPVALAQHARGRRASWLRSEERRVGKECRSRWS